MVWGNLENKKENGKKGLESKRASSLEEREETGAEQGKGSSEVIDEDQR